MMRSSACVAALAALAGSVSAQTVSVFPTTPHAAQNFIPFGVGTAAVPVNNSVLHQVIRADLFGATPVEITRIAFSPGVVGTYLGDVTIRLGYTSRTPNVAPPVGLDIPVAGGGGAPNATGAMTTFYSNAAHSQVITLAGTEAWTEFLFNGSFEYDPAQGNLLVEIVVSATFGAGVDLTVSRSAGSAEASRAFATTRFGNQPGSSGTATRMQFTYQVPTPCYADCNASGTLTIADFGCFQAAFAAGNMYADCNASGTLTIADFGCFQAEFAAGCP
jgi:hypothetical protein